MVEFHRNGLVMADVVKRRPEYMDTLAAYMTALDTANVHDAAQFQELLESGLQLMSLSNEDCARKFDVSQSSVARWRKGTTKPHPVVRGIVFAELREQARLFLLLLENYGGLTK